jgi:hypothetical protein
VNLQAEAAAQTGTRGTEMDAAGAVDEVLKAVVRQCIEKGLVKSKTIIMDSTHTLAGVHKNKSLFRCCGMQRNAYSVS